MIISFFTAGRKNGAVANAAAPFCIIGLLFSNVYKKSNDQ